MQISFWWRVCATLVVAALPSMSQAQTLEEREQSAQQQQELAEQQRKAAEARRAASMGTLVLLSDSACELSIDGVTNGALQPGVARAVPVAAGQQLMECVSAEEPSIRIERVVEAAAGSERVVTLSLADEVAGRRDARRTELRTRFEPLTEGVQDREQGVIWAARDNGSDVTWKRATAYCARLGAGWSLPSVDQLQSLYDETGAFTRQVLEKTIKPATDLIGFTGAWYWSAETAGSAVAWFVALDDSVQYSFHRSSSNDHRALCVRRS